MNLIWRQIIVLLLFSLTAAVFGALPYWGYLKHVFDQWSVVPEYSEFYDINSVVFPIRFKQGNTLLPIIRNHQNPSIQSFNQKYCAADSILFQTTCVSIDPTPKQIKKLASLLEKQTIAQCTESANRSNGWQYALALSVLNRQPHYEKTHQINHQKLGVALLQCLEILDGHSASLWHTRFSLASEVMIMALVHGDISMQKKAMTHFIDAIEALAITEGWPEGYSYWINSRALPFMLAAYSILQTNIPTDLKDKITTVVRRNGLWHIYMTRPDHQIDPFADSGPRVDLKEETAKIIDIITYITREPIFATYGEYLRKVTKPSAYHGSHRWLLPFFASHDVSVLPGTHTNLDAFNGLLPQYEVFGKGAFNQVVYRSGWGSDDVFLSIRASDIFTHHQHYDAGHFTLFRSKPIFADAATYDQVTSNNRLYYSIRTSAKNSILIHRPGRVVKPNHFFQHNVNDGGQRIIFPNWSAIRSVSHWRDNLRSGLLLEASELLHAEYDAENKVFSVKLDLTRAYRNVRAFHKEDADVKSVVREFRYYEEEFRLLVNDEVVPANPDLTVTAIFHSLAGLDEILENESNSQRAQFRLTDGTSVSITADHPIKKVSHKGEINDQYWQPLQPLSDIGDQFLPDSSNKPWFDNPQWHHRVSIAMGSYEPLVMTTEIQLSNQSTNGSTKPRLTRH